MTSKAFSLALGIFYTFLFLTYGFVPTLITWLVISAANFGLYFAVKLHNERQRRNVFTPEQYETIRRMNQ